MNRFQITGGLLIVATVAFLFSKIFMEEREEHNCAEEFRLAMELCVHNIESNPRPLLFESSVDLNDSQKMLISNGAKLFQLALDSGQKRQVRNHCFHDRRVISKMTQACIR